MTDDSTGNHAPGRPRTDIAAERMRRGWTQDDLAARVGVSTRTISNWESGRPIPRTRQLALERAFASPWEPGPLSHVDTRQLLLELLRRTDLRATL